VLVTVRLGVAFRYGCAAFCVQGAIGVARPVAMVRAASTVRGTVAALVPIPAAVAASPVSVTVIVTLNAPVVMGLDVDFSTQFGAVNEAEICAGVPEDVQFAYGGSPPVNVITPFGRLYVRSVTASGRTKAATRSGGLIVIVKFVVFVAIPSVTDRLNEQVAVLGAVTETVGCPVTWLVTGCADMVVAKFNPAQLPAFRFVPESVKVPVPGAAAVPALTFTVYVRPATEPALSVVLTPATNAACAVVTTAWALIVSVDDDVAEPAGTAMLPVSLMLIETATLVPVDVGVPESGQVGGAVEEGAIGTVSPRPANPVEEQVYVV
jgi:hypothetical protein